MVVRRRLRSFLLPLALYVVSGALAGYFFLHAQSGHRGLEAKREIKAEIINLNQELAGLREARLVAEQRISRMRDGTVDRDLLEELARERLGMTHPDDLVIITRSRD